MRWVIRFFLAACVLSAIVRPRPDYGRIKQQLTIERVDQLSLALKTLKRDIFRYPTSREGLIPLVVEPPGLKKYYWDGPYVYDSIDTDAWGDPYVYTNNGVPELSSYGADGKLGGEGVNADIIRKIQ